MHKKLGFKMIKTTGVIVHVYNKLSIPGKRLVLKLVFTDKIPYHYENGFGTANHSLPIKAFEVLAVSKSQGVDRFGTYGKL